MACKCSCHEYHLEKCGDCMYTHYTHNEPITFTDSAIIYATSEYLHRFGLVDNRVCSFYYPLIKSNAFENKETIFYSKHLMFINYLFENKSPEETKKLFHSGVILYIARYDGHSFAQGLNEEGRIKWRINA